MLDDLHAETLIDLRRNELANTATHGVGLALSLVGTNSLLTTASQTDDSRRLVACVVYAAALVAVYAASTLSHLFRQRRLRRLFRTLDQAFIYLLIVGTYTPLAIIHLHGGWLWVLFGAMWAVALFGFLSKTLWRHRVEGVSLTAYLVLGWMSLLGVKSAWELFPTPAFALFVGGGICYTFGTIFLTRDHVVWYFHSLWHLLVMAGSGCHFAAIMVCVAADAA